MTEYAIAPRTDRREQARQDRLAAAEIERADLAERSRARIAEREAAARMRLEAAAERRTAKARRRAELADAAAAVSAWISDHVTDLLFVPTIAVPAALSWTAMASFGDRLYGPAGVMLPAFSEGAMWSFAAAVTITQGRHPGRPAWHLRAGIAVFALFGAALNFLHGLAAPSGLFPGLPAGYLTGTVMALISVSGVIAHQLITAGPRGEHASENRDVETIPAADEDPEPVADEALAVLRARPLSALRPDTAPVTEAMIEADMAAVNAAIEAARTPPPAPVMTTREPATGDNTDGDSSGGTDPGTAPDTNGDSKPAARVTPKRTAARSKRGQSNAVRVRAMRRRNPEMPAAEIAKRLGISTRTVHRHLTVTTE